MKIKILVVVAILLLLFNMVSVNTFGNSEVGKYSDSISDVRLLDIKPTYESNAYLSAPKHFTENRGQLENDEVRFYAQGGDVWFTDSGVWFELREYTETRDRGSEFRSQGGVSGLKFDPMDKMYPPEPLEYRRVILEQEFVGANQVRPFGKEQLSWNSNFFYGNDPNKWCSDVPNYAEVYYENLYDGIDLRYYISEVGLKYDFIVHPGAKHEQIKIRYEGADNIKLDGLGNLVINSGINSIIDSDLFIFQEYYNIRHKIAGNFKIYNSFEYGFEIKDDYDKNQALVIDPNLVYSTYLGGTDDDRGYDIAVDALGNAYVTGSTFSFDFPNSTGANDSTHSGVDDVFVLKYSADGTKILYSTYIGVLWTDIGYGIEVDSNGNAFITGETHSPDFPTTPGAFNETISGTDEKVFVLKLNHNGSKLLYSTLIGKGIGRDIAIDSNENAYIVGDTPATNFPITPGAFSTVYNGGAQDVFITKLNSTGSNLSYSTFIGGADNEWGRDILIDGFGNAYITGETHSIDFPNSTYAFQPAYSGLWSDVFVLKLNHNGSNYFHSTFIGASAYEYGYGLELDSEGNVFVGGHTNSKDFPNTTGAYDTTFNSVSNFYDSFVLQLNHNFSKMNFSTFIGGSGKDLAWDIDIDKNGNSYITGTTSSPNFPCTIDAYDKYLNASTETFVSQISANGSELMYSTYFGGWFWERGYALELDSAENLYITGATNSPNFPNTTGKNNTPFNFYYNVYISKFRFKPIIDINSLSILRDNNPVSTIYSQYDTYNFEINLVDTVSDTDLNNVRLSLDPLGANIQLLWDRQSDQFTEVNDPFDYISIDPSSSSSFNPTIRKWKLEFNLTFHLTYPDEELSDVQIYATSATLPPAWLNISNIYQVENDLIFDGSLVVTDEDDIVLSENDLIRGGKTINWTGFKVVYDNTTDVYPADDEFNVTIWDENGLVWSDSPGEGELFNIETTTPKTTNTDGFYYTINISGIPPECDKTEHGFTLLIDTDNLSFSDPTPNNKTWQIQNNVKVGITISDHGGGEVNSSTVMQSVSLDNGNTWSNWDAIIGFNSEKIMIVNNTNLLEEGEQNLIKWQATDSVGNGPVESGAYRVLVDTEEVVFSKSWPIEKDVSYTEVVNVRITIFDATSGVNASTIEYSISEDEGGNWSTWKKIESLQNGDEINIDINLTFKNGTKNRLKWRASDIAGNGPTESSVVVINVDTYVAPIKAKVTLLSPPKELVINESIITLSWVLENVGLDGITYDLYFQNRTPPELWKVDLKKNNFTVSDLVDGDTYYWRVIPKYNGTEGDCLSGIWWFRINLTKEEVVYKLSITGPESTSLLLGENKTVGLTITNLGSKKDIVKLDLQGNEISNYVTLNDYSQITLEKLGSAKKYVLLSIPKTATTGNYSISVSAISMNSGELVKEIHSISVEIKKPTGPGGNDTNNINDTKPNGTEPNGHKQDPDKKSDDLMMYLMIAIVVIIVCLALGAIIIIRKKKAEEGALPEGAVTTKPQPQTVISIGDEPPEPEPQPQTEIPTTTPQEPAIQQSIATPTTPTVEKPPTIGQTPAPTLASQQLETPQLPPTTEPEPQESITPTITPTTEPTMQQPTESEPTESPTVQMPETEVEPEATTSNQTQQKIQNSQEEVQE